MCKVKTTLMSAAMLILSFGLPAGRNPLVGVGPAYADTAVLVKTIIGPDTVTFFGNSIGVGDFNADGGIDMIIGASDLSGSIGSPGWAYMYYGGSVFDSLWDVQYHGVQGGAGDWTAYGSAVSSAGDFYSDGYTDIVIGSPGYDAPNSNGRVYLYKGGPEADTVPLWVRTGASFAGLGYAVHCLGDLDMDGCSDIIAGAPGNYLVGGHDGNAYIYLGDSTIAGADSVPDYELWGAGDRTNENFGCSFTSGDINGDSWPDVIVGAPGSSTDTSICGRVYAFFGSSSFDTNYDLFFEGRQKTAFFGRSISHGDFNNDGYEDVIVGEYGYNSNTGRAYIYLGGASPDTVPDLILNGEQTGESFGYQVCGAGDLNGDSIDDYIISAPWHTTATDSFAGKIYLYYGGTALDTLPDVVITGWDYKDRIGRTISALGDINNDGKREFAILKWIRLSSEYLKILVYQINVNGVEGNNEGLIMNKLLLFQNQPNPFKNRTTISYKLPKSVTANLSIYNITGQRVKTLVNGIKPAGEYNVYWDGRNDNGELSPNGVYFYTLKINNYLTTKKAILLK